MPDIANLSAYGTDEEPELIKALEISFPDAEALRCFLHINKNFKQKFKALGLICEHKKIIQRIKRIVLNSYDQFDVRYMEMVNEYSGRYSALSKYLMKRKDYAAKCVHDGHLFYTDASESTNAKLQLFVSYKSSSLIQFLNFAVKFIIHEEGKAIDGYIGAPSK